MLINFNKKFGNKKFIEKIIDGYNSATKILNLPCADLEINISFVSGKEIQRLNKEFRNTDKITDVLSFPNLLEVGKTDMQLIADKLTKENYCGDINPENNCIFVGDICICKKVVKEHAKEYDNTIMREMVYMAIHGLLHLLGYDHMVDSDKVVMREMEEKIMKSINLERN